MALILSGSPSRRITQTRGLGRPRGYRLRDTQVEPTATLIGASQSLPSTMGRMIGMQLAIDWGTA